MDREQMIAHLVLVGWLPYYAVGFRHYASNGVSSVVTHFSKYSFRRNYGLIGYMDLADWGHVNDDDLLGIFVEVTANEP